MNSFRAQLNKHIDLQDNTKNLNQNNSKRRVTSIIALYTITILLMISIFMSLVYAQETLKNDKELEQTGIILVSIFGVAVVMLFLFLARDIILRRKTSYDTQDLESKKEKTFEKYHSDWSDDYEEVGRRGNTKRDQEFRDAANSGELEDYYKILDVKPDATQEEIKQKFRIKVKETHPDRTRQQTEEDMAKLNQAYEILSDVNSRAKYDKYRKQT